MISGPITINGETITPEMVASVEEIADVIDITRGPFDPSGGDDFRRFAPTGILTIRLYLKDGRAMELRTTDLKRAAHFPAPAKDPA